MIQVSEWGTSEITVTDDGLYECPDCTTRYCSYAAAATCDCD